VVVSLFVLRTNHCFLIIDYIIVNTLKMNISFIGEIQNFQYFILQSKQIEYSFISNRTNGVVFFFSSIIYKKNNMNKIKLGSENR